MIVKFFKIELITFFLLSTVPFSASKAEQNFNNYSGIRDLIGNMEELDDSELKKADARFKDPEELKVQMDSNDIPLMLQEHKGDRAKTRLPPRITFDPKTHKQTLDYGGTSMK